MSYTPTKHDGRAVLFAVAELLVAIVVVVFIAVLCPLQLGFIRRARLLVISVLFVDLRLNILLTPLSVIK